MNVLSSFNPDKWVDKYADQLFVYCTARVNDPQLAEDIVQNTFLSAWKAKETFNGTASEKNWLYAICKNKIIDQYRKKQHEVVSLSSSGEEELYFDKEDHWTNEATPAAWRIGEDLPLDKKDFYGVLNKCKSKLKEIQQQVFAMKYMDDIDAEEICRLLGITSANYWVMIHRAKLHLRSCLEKNWINDN